MKKVLTAIGNPELNNKLRENNIAEVIEKDIPYQEAVIEILEKNKIDFLILKSNLPGELNLEKLIKNIKKINEKIKIIYLLNENEKSEKILKEKNIKIIYLNNKINTENLINEINKIINENNQLNKTNKTSNYLNSKEPISNTKANNKKTIKNKIKLDKIINNKNKLIISFYGKQGIGKSTTAIIFSQIFKQLKYEKILIIDFNIYNQNIYSILKTKKYSTKIYNKINKKNNEELFIKNKQKFINKHFKNELNKKAINYYKSNIQKLAEDFTIKTEKGIDFISGLDLLFKRKDVFYVKEKEKVIKELFRNLKEKYDVILIDTGLQDEAKINEILFQESSKIVLLVEPNLLGIKEGKRDAEKCKRKYKINEQSLHIVVNKCDKNSVDSWILKSCFRCFGVTGKINYNKMSSTVNQNNDKFVFENLKKKEINNYKKIVKRLL